MSVLCVSTRPYVLPCARSDASRHSSALHVFDEYGSGMAMTMAYWRQAS